jgi:hypothetical protein
MVLAVLGIATAAPGVSVSNKFLIAGPPAFSVSAAFDGANYLVGIQGDAVHRARVGAQLISQSGALVGSLISTGHTGSVPLVAFDGANYLLVWVNDETEPQNQVYAQLVSPSGRLLGTPFRIGPLSGGQEIGAVAFGGGKYLVAWGYPLGPPTGLLRPYASIEAQLVSPQGTLLGSPISIDTHSEQESGGGLAFDGANFLAVWGSKRSGQAIWDVSARFISSAGVPGDRFVISQTGTASLLGAVPAFNGTNHLVIWGTEAGSLRGRIVSPAGALVTSEFSIGPVDSLGGAFVAFDGADFLLALTDLTNDTNHNWACDPGEGTCTDIYGQFLSPTGALVGPQFPINIDPGNQLISPVTFGGGKYLVIWRDGDLPDSTNGAVYGAFVTPLLLPAHLTVTTLADSGAGSLRQAIADIAEGGTIDFAVTGTIILTSGELRIAKSLSIEGPGAASLTLSGNGVSRVFSVGAPATISGLTVTNGRADFGGGILNEGTLVLTGVTITGNDAAIAGGGIANGTSAFLTATDSAISHNTAAIAGSCSQPPCGSGGIANGGTLVVTNTWLQGNSTGFAGGGIGNIAGATLTLTNSSVTDNRAGSDTSCTPTDCGGGGIASSGMVTITSSTLARNRSGLGGGGIGSIGGGAILTVTDSTLSDNAAGTDIRAGSDVSQCDSARCSGGGITNTGTATLTDSTVSTNHAAMAAGGLSNGCFNGSCGTMSVIKSTVSGNSAGSHPSCTLAQCGGSGIGNAASLTLVNSTISGNSTDFGGGGIGNNCIEGTCGTATLSSTTIAGNSASFGGGIGNGCVGTQCATLDLKNNILAAQLNGGNCASMSSDAIRSGGHNLADDGSCRLRGPGDQSKVPACLGPLAANGGSTKTHALLPCSPAIDAGDNQDCPLTDQRGAPRPVNANCDIGAYEFGGVAPTPSPTPTTCLGECDGDGGVTVSELITMVNIALGTQDISACTAGDGDHNGEITISEIIVAVNNALNGCAVALSGTVAAGRAVPGATVTVKA